MLPAGLVAYRQTPVFDQDSIPAMLRREHRTKPGVWALIHVLDGQLAYRTFDPATAETLTSEITGVIGARIVVGGHEVALGPQVDDLRLVSLHGSPDLPGPSCLVAWLAHILRHAEPFSFQNIGSALRENAEATARQVAESADHKRFR